MQSNLWFDLQFFAEAGAAAADGGSPSGDNAAAAGQTVLEGLGVPADRRDKWAKSKVRREIPAAKETQESGNSQQTDEGDAGQTAGGKASFDDLIKDPEYKQAFDARMQAAIKGRLGEAGKVKDTFEKLRPALEFAAKKYGMDTDNLDYEALAANIMKDDSFVERYADEHGVSLDDARDSINDKLELSRLRREKQITLDRQTLQTHIQKLRQQAEEVRQFNPDFDLDAEIQNNAAFARMTSPQIGMSVADAYFATHRKEILTARDQQQTQEAIRAVTESIRAGQSRPKENGASTPSSVTPFDYRNLNAEERAAFKKRLNERFARGEKPLAGTIR